jgi:hypothetical protein
VLNECSAIAEREFIFAVSHFPQGECSLNKEPQVVEETTLPAPLSARKRDICARASLPSAAVASFV